MDIDRLLGNRLLDRLLDPIITPLQNWLMEHPFWNWLFVHPLWLLGLIVLVLFLFAGLMGAIARLTEALWIAILQAPLKLAQWLFIGVIKLFRLPFAPKVTALTISSPNQHERLAMILDRLEALRQEQDELIQEVRSILALQNSDFGSDFGVEKMNVKN